MSHTDFRIFLSDRPSETDRLTNARSIIPLSSQAGHHPPHPADVKPVARDYYVRLLALKKLPFVAEFLVCLSKAEALRGAARNLLSARGR